MSEEGKSVDSFIANLTEEDLGSEVQDQIDDQLPGFEKRDSIMGILAQKAKGMVTQVVNKQIERQRSQMEQMVRQYSISSRNNLHVKYNVRIPIRKGYIKRFCPALVGGEWKYVYIHIDHRMLRQYSSDNLTKAQLTGCINFDLFSVTLDTQSYPENSFEFSLSCNTGHEGKKEVRMKAASQIDFFLWTNIIERHIQNSKGYQKQLNAPDGKFWLHEQITEEQFITKADTFDLLLFRCHTAGGAISRKFMHSEIDHIAMIVRFDSDNASQRNEVYVLEATAKMGVSLKKWSDMREKLGSLYDMVIMRHLQMDRTDKQIELLGHFLKEACGQKYSLTPKKLFQRTSTCIKDQEALEKEHHLIEANRGFFCSELVAKCLKCCHVMKPTEESSTNYLPKNFTTEEFTPELIDEARYQPELFVIKRQMDKL